MGDLMADTAITKSQCAVAIMAKAPQPGQVKTRLCPPLTHAEATQLYACFLRDKIAQVNALSCVAPVVSYAPDDVKSVFQDLAPSHFRLIAQRGDDLGARILCTFDQLFQQGHTQVIVIDSDTPTLPTAYIEEAHRLIATPQNDVVLGPTEDGGYYLIGLRQSHRELFERMPWSTSQVFLETKRRCERSGLTVACTDSWYDIDTAEDLARLMKSLDHLQDGAAQQTKRYLQGLRR